MTALLLQPFFPSLLSASPTSGANSTTTFLEANPILDVVHTTAVGITAAFVVITCVWSGINILQHILNYTKPDHQRYITRILLMVPIYVVASWLSLFFKRNSWFMFVDLFRDCYESYVIYIFFKLCVNMLGGVEACEVLMNQKPKQRCLMPLCLLPYKPGKSFYLWCLRGVLQYVILKPLCTFIAVILHFFALFEEGDFTPTGGYLYLSIITNISVCIALYCLAAFYELMRHELSPHSPFLKFLCIKGIIFFTYWQSVIIAIMSFFGVFGQDAEIKKFYNDLINDSLVCTEMLVAAIVHTIAFSHKPYIYDSEEALIGNKSKFQKLVYKIKRLQPGYNYFNFWKTEETVKGVINVAGQGDVIQDTIYSVQPIEIQKVKENKSKFAMLDEDEDVVDHEKNHTDEKNVASVASELKITINNEDSGEKQSIFRITIPKSPRMPITAKPPSRPSSPKKSPAKPIEAPTAYVEEDFAIEFPDEFPETQSAPQPQTSPSTHPETEAQEHSALPSETLHVEAEKVDLKSEDDAPTLAERICTEIDSDGQISDDDSLPENMEMTNEMVTPAVTPAVETSQLSDVAHSESLDDDEGQTEEAVTPSKKKKSKKLRLKKKSKKEEKKSLLSAAEEAVDNIEDCQESLHEVTIPEYKGQETSVEATAAEEPQEPEQHQETTPAASAPESEQITSETAAVQEEQEEPLNNEEIST